MLVDVERDRCGLLYERLFGSAEVLEGMRRTARWRGAYPANGDNPGAGWRLDPLETTGGEATLSLAARRFDPIP